MEYANFVFCPARGLSGFNSDLVSSASATRTSTVPETKRTFAWVRSITK